MTTTTTGTPFPPDHPFPAQVYVDTNVFLYAVGGDHPWRAPSRAFLDRIAEGSLTAHVSTETIQEFAFHRARLHDTTIAVQQARLVEEMCRLHSFDPDVLAAALDLMATGQARGRDAVHAATALQSGISVVVSVDPAFDTIPGITRLSPS